MSRTRARRSVELTDPRALRAVAHPLRLSLISLLRRDGPLTATQAGAKVGESPASCSFHLRQLAKYGLVEEAGGGRGRERPWRATAQFTSWPEVADDPELLAASQLLSKLVAERYFQRALTWLERLPDEPGEWAEAAAFGDRILYLTSNELAELKRDLDELGDRYFARTSDPSLRPEGSRRITFLQIAFPERDDD
jgi:predicted ArsR family transcriptional regulator